jgi:hypothetical protein
MASGGNAFEPGRALTPSQRVEHAGITTDLLAGEPVGLDPRASGYQMEAASY